jgi:hypothetical protein
MHRLVEERGGRWGLVCVRLVYHSVCVAVVVGLRLRPRSPRCTAGDGNSVYNIVGLEKG